MGFINGMLLFLFIFYLVFWPSEKDKLEREKVRIKEEIKKNNVIAEKERFNIDLVKKFINENPHIIKKFKKSHPRWELVDMNNLIFNRIEEYRFYILVHFNVYSIPESRSSDIIFKIINNKHTGENSVDFF